MNFIKTVDRVGDTLHLNADSFVCAHQRIERGTITDINLGEEGRGVACGEDLDSFAGKIKAKLIVLTLNADNFNFEAKDTRLFIDPTKIRRLALQDDKETVVVLVQNEAYVIEESTEEVLELISKAGIKVNII